MWKKGAWLQIAGKRSEKNQNDFYCTRQLKQQLFVMLLATTIAKYKVKTEQIIDFPNKSNYTQWRKGKCKWTDIPTG